MVIANGDLPIVTGPGPGAPPAKLDEPDKVAQRPVDFGPELEKMLADVGSIELTDKEKEILFAPVDPDTVEIRPDGIVYLPWLHYVKKMRDAIGLGWGLIAQGFPKVKGDIVIGYYAFIIRKVLIGFFFGEQSWPASNRQMSFTDAVEGARSNALMRGCKAIGVSLDLWDPDFIREWKSKYARQIDINEKKTWVKINPEQVGPGENIIDTVKEVFPGSKVTPGVTGMSMPSDKIPDLGSDPLKETPQSLGSANLFVRLHDEMIRLNHLEILRSWWTKHCDEAEQKLLPKHWKMLCELKDKLRKDFKEQALKKGGK